MKILKRLAIAALSLAMLAPAYALPQLNTTDPAYRVAVTFRLYRELRQCDNVDLAQAETMVTAIVKQALSENPAMDTGYMFRKEQEGPYMGRPSREDCKLYFQNLLDIRSGVVFQ